MTPGVECTRFLYTLVGLTKSITRQTTYYYTSTRHDLLSFWPSLYNILWPREGRDEHSSGHVSLLAKFSKTVFVREAVPATGFVSWNKFMSCEGGWNTNKNDVPYRWWKGDERVVGVWCEYSKTMPGLKAKDLRVARGVCGARGAHRSGVWLTRFRKQINDPYPCAARSLAPETAAQRHWRGSFCFYQPNCYFWVTPYHNLYYDHCYSGAGLGF